MQILGYRYVLMAIIMCLAPLAQASLSVVTTIRPLHGIAMALSQDTENQVNLLLNGNTSPHHYLLKPSDTNKLQQANLVVALHPTFETFLGKYEPTSDNLLFTGFTPGLNLLTRENSDETDWHIWLDINNMKIIASEIANTLSQLDNDHDDIYQRNLMIFLESLTLVDHEISMQLQGVADQSFMVYHDAYRYFVKQYGLNQLGTLHYQPNLPLSPKKLQQLLNAATSANIVCFFTEPQFENPNLNKLLAEYEIQTATIDPLGADLPLDNTLYLDLMRTLANKMGSCLKGQP